MPRRSHARASAASPSRRRRASSRSAVTVDACLLSALMELVATARARRGAAPESIHAAKASSGAKLHTEATASAVGGGRGSAPRIHSMPTKGGCRLRDNASTRTPACTNSGNRKWPIWLLAPQTSTASVCQACVGVSLAPFTSSRPVHCQVPVSRSLYPLVSVTQGKEIAYFLEPVQHTSLACTG